MKYLLTFLIVLMAFDVNTTIAADHKRGTVNYLTVRDDTNGKAVKFTLSDNSCPGPNHYYVLQTTNAAFSESYSLLLAAKMANKEIVVSSTSCPGNNYVYLAGQGNWISFPPE